MIYIITQVLSSTDYQNGENYASSTLEYAIGTIIFLSIVIIGVIAYTIYSVIQYRKRGGLSGQVQNTIKGGKKIVKTGTKAATIIAV